MKKAQSVKVLKGRRKKYMSVKKSSKFERLRATFAGFLAFICIFTGVSATVLQSNDVHAISNNITTVEDPDTETTETTDENESITEDETTTETTADTESNASNKSKRNDTCKDSLGALGWLVCPTTGAIAKGVDFLYNLISDFLVINPISTEDGTPIYEIWKYFRGFTNIVFIIFLLIVIYSQITGLGISNYGVKKSLPKLIVAAIMVNLSFVICLLAVDASNIIGNSLRGLFTSIQETTMATSSMEAGALSYTGMYSAMAGGTALAIGGAAIAFEAGAIWMLIPTALGALVAAVTGLITIALRQAVVVLLIMISPLAMVANILPNTEKWFKKWKELLMKMLVFYPMFSLLFGASSLAGFAIIMSAKNGWGLLLGTAVQIFPLFFSWSLMKMSGTFLGDINSRMRGIASGSLASNRAWADSHRMATKQRMLASDRRTRTPSLRLMQFINSRRIAREEDTNENAALARNRALAARAQKNWQGRGATGAPTKRGERAYSRIAQNLEYQQVISRDKNTMNKGLGYLAAEGTVQRARLDKLDARMVTAADMLKVEQARGEKIEYENARGFHNRMEAAMNAHMDDVNGFKKEGDRKVQKEGYKFHFDPNNLAHTAELSRYNAMHQIMEGNESDVQYAVATAARGYDTQRKIHESTIQTYFNNTVPTKDIVFRMNEMTQKGNAVANIDAIVAGLRVLNQRGDTDLVKGQLDNVLSKELGGGVQLGTNAAQSLASFLMFEVKDNDPALRRFGKYINLETARMYNNNDRKESSITYDEYLKGYHEEPDGTIMYAKKDAKKLLEGTSLDSIERTALSNLDESLKKAYGFVEGKDGSNNWDVKGYLKKREEIQTAFEPAFLSASLKWLSGSEQINSGIKFWTGYELKQKKDENGQLIVDEDKNPVYDLVPVWEDNGFGEHKGEVEKYFRKKANDYIKDQTTGQILNMRTDYRDPIMEHLLATYLEADSDKELSAERNREYREAYDEIQTRYADEPAKDAKKKREADVKAMKMKLAGKQLRKILGESGKLKQIYRTRTSGTAINAKDWLRRWVNLDDEDALRREMNYYDSQRAKKANTANSTNDTNDASHRIYDADTREIFLNDLQALKDKIADEPTEDFFQDTMEQLDQWFGEGSFMAKKYEQYYRKDDPSADSIELYKYLRELLSDPDNYPDA